MCKQGHDLAVHGRLWADGKRHCAACHRAVVKRQAATHPRTARSGGGVHPMARIGERIGSAYLVYAYGTPRMRAGLETAG